MSCLLYKVGRNDLPEAVSPAEGTTSPVPLEQGMCLAVLFQEQQRRAGVPGLVGAAESAKRQGVVGRERSRGLWVFTPSEMRRDGSR